MNIKRVIREQWFWILYFGVCFIFIILMGIAKYKYGIEFNDYDFWGEWVKEIRNPQ
jgi:hypothetical protein